MAAQFGATSLPLSEGYTSDTSKLYVEGILEQQLLPFGSLSWTPSTGIPCTHRPCLGLLSSVGESTQVRKFAPL